MHKVKTLDAVRTRPRTMEGLLDEVDCADHLSAGLERLTKSDIDVLLLDLRLPDSQGIGTLERVQAEVPDVPVMVLTGMADEAPVVEAVRKGAQDYLFKGQVDSNLLVRAIRYAIERKRAEEALRELDRMKSEFISNVSHELRSPLHAIKGFTRLILEGKVPNPETQKEFLAIVDEQSTHLSSLVDNLLDMSRIESERFSIQKRPTLINNIIHGAVKSFYAVAKEKGIVITKDIPTTLPEIEVDRERLKQVMVNLLSNAIKFSEDGGPVMVKVDTRGSELLVQVTDHGIGIPKEAMPHLFERFHQVETASRIRGTGLGLYISKQIIEAHGGRIWAESKQGAGSTFSFTLPLSPQLIRAFG